MKKLILSIIPVFCMVVSIVKAGPTLNGGFETGDFTGWTLTNVSSGGSARASVESSYLTWTPAEGSYFARIKTDGPSLFCTLSQSFTAAAGDSLSFKYFFDFVASADDISYGRLRLNSTGDLVQEFFYWGEGGTLLADDADVPSTGGWQLETYTFTTDDTYYTLEFGIRNSGNANTDSYMGVDYVKLTSPPPLSLVPAPGAILLGGIGIGLVGWLRKRRAL